MVVRLQVRHDTKQGWEYNNPILANGEIGVEIDNELIANRMKVGNGNDKWNDLKYIDEHLVHSVPTGAEAENIDGEKVFNDDVTIKSNIHLPSDKTIEGMFSHAESDSEGNVISEFYQRTLSYVDNYVDESTDWNTCVNNGVYEVYASSFNEGLNTPLQYKDNIGTQGFLLVYADKDGNVMQVYKPALTTSSTATVIPVYRIKDDSVDTWTAWTSFNDADTNIVHTFNNEEISGVKTFINKVVINNGVLELGNGVGASEIKKKNGETILTEDSNGLTLSTARNTIRFRPNGSNESNGEVVINNDGVINGKALKDSEGNVITNVYTKKADVIKTAKAHTLAESELLSSNEYPEYYQKVLDKKKKSFDISKFTVVGSPTIMDNGIASGFNKNNYLTIPAISFSKTNNIKIKIRHKIFTSSLGSGENDFFISTGNHNAVNTINLMVHGTNQKIVAWIGGVSKESVQSLALGKEYDFVYETLNGQFRLSATEVGTSTTIATDWGIIPDDFLSNATMYIGNCYNGTAFYGFGSINLKSFLIMVDGEEVFNGHEERIDTIKADNYEIIGSPVISVDGVASGFGASKYVKTPLLDFSKPFEIYCQFTLNNSATTAPADNYIFSTVSNRYFSVAVMTNLRVRARLGNGTGWTEYPTNYTCNIETKYYIKLNYDGATFNLYISTNGKDYSLILTKELNVTYPTSEVLGLGIFPIVNAGEMYGSIDLNAFKIYVDGNLVYQPCLKIPYTYSEDGTKVVDIGYMDRVEDCYNQFGTGNYFILDEYNNMFQMPLDTVDGYTRTLYNYRKGKTSYNYNTDLECNYSDTCVSGTRYNFLKPFADSNYTLTVPTSSKDATGFTPTSTVDFMAKGRITLD